MKIVCIYHSQDIDGWMSAGIVKHWHAEHVKVGKFTALDSIEFIGYNYGDPIPDLSEYDKVIMCDISFPRIEMHKLASEKDFIWIDHHISAITENIAFDKQCYEEKYKGIRGINFAACELTWFYMNNPINNAVIDLTSFKRYEEKWININDIYSISNYGRVLSKEREVNHIGGKAYRPNKILKHIIDGHGYSRVTINGVSEKVHKLVAKYFLTGSGETVNHIDGNKENNCVSNLEYTSYKENNIHAIENGLRTSGFGYWQSKTVEQYKDNILINTFGSTNEASKETGISQGNIAAVCRYYQGVKSKFRNRTQADGFVFKYKDEVKEETRFERSTLKRNINIGSILSQSDSLELDSNEKEVHKFFNTPEIVSLLGRYDCFGHKTKSFEMSSDGYDKAKQYLKEVNKLKEFEDNKTSTDGYSLVHYANDVAKRLSEEQKVLEFQYGARQCITNYEEAYKYLIACRNDFLHESGQYFDNTLNQIYDKGKAIYQYLCQEAKQVYKNGFDIKFNITDYYEDTQIPMGSHNVKFICINKERFNPINFDIDYHKDGYDGCACFWYNGSEWCFSLYNDNGKVDCSKLAAQFKGGGHAGAAGFRIKDINKFFKEHKINKNE